MKGLRWLAAALAAVGLGFVLTMTAASVPSRTSVTLNLLKPTSYTSNGDAISGWHWLRNSANTAEWTFDPAESVWLDQRQRVPESERSRFEGA